MKNKILKMVANKTVLAMDTYLRIDANSASCCIVYQPKAPNTLERYRRTK